MTINANRNLPPENYFLITLRSNLHAPAKGHSEISCTRHLLPQEQSKSSCSEIPSKSRQKKRVNSIDPLLLMWIVICFVQNFQLWMSEIMLALQRPSWFLILLQISWNVGKTNPSVLDPQLQHRQDATIPHSGIEKINMCQMMCSEGMQSLSVFIT